MTDTDVRVTSPQRIGPVSRIVRLVLAAGVGWLSLDWTDAGLSGFSQPSIAANPWLWIIVAAGLYGAFFTISNLLGRQWGVRAAAGLLVLGAVTAVVALVVNGSLWAPPLTELLYWFVVVFLVSLALAFVVSAAVGTRGCEYASFAELIRRALRVPEPVDAETTVCLIGLHRLDEWEARQPWRHRS